MNLNKHRLENSPSVHQLIDFAAQRDNSAADFEVTIKRDHIKSSLDDNGNLRVNIGQSPLGTDGAWKGFAEMLRSADGVPIPVNCLKSLDPDTLDSLVTNRVTKEKKQVRMWTPANGGADQRIIRGIVSPGYHRISAMEQVQQLISRMHDQQIDTHKLVKISNDPDQWSAEIVDASRPMQGFNDPEYSDSYNGFKFSANDIGGGSCAVTSYLWRLICENGMVAVLGNARMRAIHRGSGDWTGNLYTGADWKELLTAAQNETFTDSDDMFDRLKALANRPGTKAVRQSLDEALKLSGNNISRWSLAQGASAAANKTDDALARNELQKWAGRLIELPTSKSLPTLETLLSA